MITKYIKPIQRQTLTTDVYEQLKNIIISGRMVPGEKISLRPTAEILNVSIMPVREAIQRLIADQALEMMPNRTIRVPILSEQLFLEVTKVRMTLEGLAVLEATPKIKHDLLQEATNLAKLFELEMEKDFPDGVRLVNLNKELHFVIYKAAEMPILLHLIEALWLRVGPILNYDIQKRYRKTTNIAAIDNHNQLITALKNKKPELAKAALINDINSAADYILSSGVLLMDESLDSI